MLIHVAALLQSGALYANIRHDPRSEYNWQKSERGKCQWSWEVWGCSETPVGGFGGQSTLRKFFSFKGTLSGLSQFLATESPLKMMKNAFYFTSKALFVLKIFKFLS